jgi:two-component system, OmpR family, sensor kinase
MFRRRLTFVLALMAAVAVLQGTLALWAVGVAETQVLRGRVASDIQLAFAQLAADKYRLRLASDDPAASEALRAAMQTTLQRLHGLAASSRALDTGEAARTLQAERDEALVLLGRSLDTLEPGDTAELRLMLARSVAREAEAVREKRADADHTLAWLRRLWIGTAATLALAALGLALYVAQVLRHPLARLADGVRAMQRGDLDHRIELHGPDEFSALARGVNTMAGELAQHRQREVQARQALEEQVDARTRELSQAVLALQEAEARRRQLFADISHELRTPTTAIRGEAQVTLRGVDKPVGEYKATLARIADAARQLGSVIDDLLTMARSDADTLSLRRETLDFAGVMQQALSHGEALARERGVAIEPSPGPGAVPGPLPMQGDAVRLRQLLLALLDNAVRYSHPGGRVRVAARCFEQDGAWVEVSIADDGIGVDAADLALVFERHHRGERARRHRADGSGLGLPIARALARGHGGDIRLTSTPGAGTTASVRLPLLALPADTPQPTRQSAPEAT